MLSVLLLVVLAVTAGSAVGLFVWRYPRIAKPGPTPTLDTARAVGETVGRRPALRHALAARLDPAAATGLALTVAMALTIAGGVLFGVLAYLVRTNSSLTRVDNGVAKWGHRHATATGMHDLNLVTQLGSIYTIVALCLVLAAVATIRHKTVWALPFIVAVMGGEEALTLTVKDLANRLRPTFNPAAATLGPSFPSGHSATAAAFYATAALLLGRGLARPGRALLAALAVAIAVAVAASRVLLDVHWLTDVIAGLSLGWVWFSICAMAFGGRILRFGAAAETAGRVAHATEVAETRSSRRAGQSRVIAGTRRGPEPADRPVEHR